MAEVQPGVGELLSRLGLEGRERDHDLYELALTHRSYAFEAGGLPHNERLEFLGDAVLGVVVADVLYHRLPEAPEGRLAKLRSAAVNTASLAGVARGLGLGAFVRLGKGEEASGGRDKDSILADTLEAVIGAVHLDAGMQAATRWVAELFTPLLEDLVARGGALDAKTALQELTAAHLATLPAYEVTDEGPDHRKRFTARVAVDGEVLGSGSGGSKKRAEQEAARAALAVLGDRLAVSSRPAGASAGDGTAAAAAPPPLDDPQGGRP